MQLFPRSALEREASEQRAFGKRIGVLALQQLPVECEGLLLPGNPDDYAHGLYAALRHLDRQGHNLLLVERPPDTPAWVAVLDRLRRAAAGAGEDDDAP